MARFIGLDVHKKFIEVCIIDNKGKVTFRGQSGLRSAINHKLCQVPTEEA